MAEATMNAMEHGNKYSADKAVSIEVVRDEQDLTVSITDRVAPSSFPTRKPRPDRQAGWQQSLARLGLFSSATWSMTFRVVADDRHHTVNLIIHLSGGER